MRFMALLIVPLLLACAGTSAPPDGARRTIDIAAENYVRLALEIDTHEEGYVDAYFGPGEWREEARANPRSVEQLKPIAETIAAQLTSAAESDTDENAVRRVRTMLAAVQSARFRLDMIGGARAPFLDEAERLFALRPALRSLESLEPALVRIDALLAGEGPLIERVEALRARHAIPLARLPAVMDRAIAECRARTQARLPLPKGESFRMEFVTGRNWSAYNWYQGANQSLIQVNTDLPVTIDRALTLACHEGYPGHHVQGIYNERLYRERGWIEYSVAPLYHPSSPMNEGAANFGVELAFPGDERLAFERDVLYPLAGLEPGTAARYSAVLQALSELAAARLTIAAMYLNGEIDRERALALMQRYQLLSRARAEQSLRFTEHYRAYVINYVSGEDLIRAYVDRVGGADPGARWAAFERIMSQPTLPQDLAP
jgi:hypothetical protein